MPGAFAASMHYDMLFCFYFVEPTVAAIFLVSPLECPPLTDDLSLHAGVLQQANGFDLDGAPVCVSRAGAYRFAATGGVCVERG